MATSQKAIAFNVEMDFTLKDTPGSIVKKIKAAEEKIEMRRSLSKEDLDAKLETAVFRKKNIEAEKISRYGSSFARATSVSEQMRQTREVAAQEISARLAAAAEKKEVVIQTRKSKLEEHIKVVDARKDGAHDFRSDMTHDDIEANLLAAEIRRKALAVQAFEKLAEHHRKVEAVKDITASPKVELLTTLHNKLDAAEGRRKQFECNRMAQLAKWGEHCQEVRKRKTANGA